MCQSAHSAWVNWNWRPITARRPGTGHCGARRQAGTGKHWAPECLLHGRHWAALGTKVLANVWAPVGTVLQLGALGDFLLKNMMLANNF